MIKRELYHLSEDTVLEEKYVIGEVLGFGGFGTIYKAWDKLLETTVAIKEYYPASIVNRIPGETEVKAYSEKGRKELRNGVARFMQEAQNMAKFNHHPNIVNVFNYFEANGTAYIVMEYLDGVSMKEYIKRVGGKMDVDTALITVKEVISALKALHGKNILHRDISPDNIFVNKNGTVKLIDFGAASFSDDTEKTRAIVLKPGYAPYEQYQKKSKQGPWTDVYALGATLYRMITGVVPDESSNRAQEDNLAEPQQLVPEIPDYVNSIILKAMSLQPEMRFQNVRDMERCIDSKEIVLSQEEELKRRKLKRVIYIGAIVTAILCAGAGSLGYYQHQKARMELKEAEISVWMPYSEKENVVEKEEDFLKAIEEFQNTYTDVTVQLELIPEEDYEEELRQAIDADNLPTVFDSTCLEETELENVIMLDDIAENLESGNLFYTEKWNKNHLKRIPTGMNVPIVFVNTQLWNERKSTGINSLNLFLEEEDWLYIGDSADYKMIQEKLPGKYMIIENLSETEIVGLNNYWSVSRSDIEEEEIAGARLVYYMLGENAQDARFSAHLPALPISKTIFGVIAEINPELSYMTDSMERYTVGELDKEIYEQMYLKITDNSQILEQIEQQMNE